jgi:hypothetical protein
MSERFGIADHAPQHAPDHATQNPTAQGSWSQGGAADDGWPPNQAPAGGSGSFSYAPISVAPTPKGIKRAIVLAMLLGPLGLFYVSLLNGIVALFVVVPLARWLAYFIFAALGGRVELVTAAILALWCVTVPWAIIGTRRRNAKLGF